LWKTGNLPAKLYESNYNYLYILVSDKERNQLIYFSEQAIASIDLATGKTKWEQPLFMHTNRSWHRIYNGRLYFATVSEIRTENSNPCSIWSIDLAIGGNPSLLVSGMFAHHEYNGSIYCVNSSDHTDSAEISRIDLASGKFEKISYGCRIKDYDNNRTILHEVQVLDRERFDGKYMTVAGECKKLFDLEKMKEIPMNIFDGYAYFDFAVDPARYSSSLRARQPFFGETILCARKIINKIDYDTGKEEHSGDSLIQFWKLR
jgi:hypothetical protein